MLSRLTTDMTIVENMVGSSISVALRNLLTFDRRAVAWLIWVSPGYTGLVVLVGAGGDRRRCSCSAGACAGSRPSAQERFADAVAYAGETLDGLDTVQAFGREQRRPTGSARRWRRAFRASLARITRAGADDGAGDGAAVRRRRLRALARGAATLRRRDPP